MEGELKHRKYQDRDGIDRYITEVEAYILKSLDRRESTGSTDEKEEYVAPATNTSDSEGDEPEMDDDLPF